MLSPSTLHKHAVPEQHATIRSTFYMHVSNPCATYVYIIRSVCVRVTVRVCSVVVYHTHIPLIPHDVTLHHHNQVRRVAHICLVNLLEEEQAKELLLQLLCSAIVHLLTSEGNHDLRMDAISVSTSLCAL